ncbi:hypothetical protein roselon_01150 [Roseibacterium elongatum DSM 19469]|uniref:Uncharacterized protein n=1 Tax=Roseicyclus elongatus DSM 19469 TaxID=1294273 RepID=W8S429_9RHOB|nr:hypothetical protein [Roseibacterium elongatum]AHM03541.1 hypothetical protein roselon_01150 [Roseibacterium elongatum DSM 19469]
MSGLETLTQTGLQAGQYQAVFEGPPETGLEAVHHGKVIAVARMVGIPDQPGAVRVSVDLPAEVLSSGVQVIAMRSTTTGEILDRITFMAGDALDDDLRGEIALLRDELEILKAAFRRYVAAGA